MKLEDIHALWATDAQIDQTDLATESLKIPSLHAKYLRLFSYEKLLFQKMTADNKVLRLDKHEFYTMGPTKETVAKGWQQPARGVVLKSMVDEYIDADSDMIASNQKLGLQKEKVEALDSIVRIIVNRNFSIKNAIDFTKFMNGA